MSNYTLLSAVTQILPLPPSPIIRPVSITDAQSIAVQSGNLQDPNLKITPAATQCFQLVVVGSGAVSAAAQIYGSNDRLNWAKVGNPIIASGTNSGTAGGGGSIGYSFFGALLTAISGTNASATVTMNA